MYDIAPETDNLLNELSNHMFQEKKKYQEKGHSFTDTANSMLKADLKLSLTLIMIGNNFSG